MNIRHATKQDISIFYGYPTVPLKMLALVDGEETVGVGGVAWCEDGVFAVSSLTEEARNDRIALGTFAAAVMSIVESVGDKVYATPDAFEPTSRQCLEHLGFRPEGDRYVYRTDLPGRFFLRHAQRAARALQADARATGSAAGAGEQAGTPAGDPIPGIDAVDDGRGTPRVCAHRTGS